MKMLNKRRWTFFVLKYSLHSIQKGGNSIRSILRSNTSFDRSEIKEIRLTIFVYQVSFPLALLLHVFYYNY